MQNQFLWVVKDSKSEHLSRSSRSEESKIRRHVQRQRLIHQERTSSVEHTQIAACNKLPNQAWPHPLYPDLTWHERRSLSFFTCWTAREWSSWEDNKFWNTLVLQACYLDLHIAYGLIAIATWHEYCTSPSAGINRNQLEAFALTQCVKAFASGRISKHSTMSINLISCIILSTLQNFRADYQAYRLLRSARAMLNDLNSLDEKGFVESIVTRGFIVKEVRPILSRMEARLYVMCDQPAALLHSVQHSQTHQSSQYLPTIREAFPDLRSARDCLEAILDWGHNHVLAFLNAGNKETFNTILHWHIDQWQATLSQCQSFDASKILLHIVSLNGLVLLSTFNSRAETDFDAYNPILGRIIDLVAQLPSSNQAHKCVSFGTDTGLIGIIAFVGSRCRDPAIRHYALEWLLEAERLEGDRLRSNSGHIIRAWMILEEAGGRIRESGDILETARRRLVAGECYYTQKRLKLIFARAPYDSSAQGKTDVVWLDDNNPANYKTVELIHREDMPDVVFSPCHAAFLDDEQAAYYHIHTSRFYFPIPKT
jgi:hypothetical protein